MHGLRPRSASPKYLGGRASRLGAGAGQGAPPRIGSSAAASRRSAALGLATRRRCVSPRPPLPLLGSPCIMAPEGVAARPAVGPAEVATALAALGVDCGDTLMVRTIRSGPACLAEYTRSAACPTSTVRPPRSEPERVRCEILVERSTMCMYARCVDACAASLRTWGAAVLFSCESMIR